MESHFYLKKPADKNSKLRIYLHFFYNGNRLQYPTGIKVKEKHWNAKKEFILSADMNAADHNERLRLILKEIQTAYMFYLNQGIIPDNEALKTKLTELINKPKKEVKGFYDYLNDFIELKKPPKYSKSRYQNYLYTKKYLQQFEKEYRYKIDFNTLNDSFLNLFYKFQIIDLDNEDNTFDSYIKNINTFCRWSYENDFYQAKKPISFPRSPKNQIPISLTISELKTILNSDFGENTKLNNIRDLFCFGCVTGMRVAAMLRLTPNHIQNDTIHYATDKSKKIVDPPLTNIAKDIIKRHKGNTYLLPQMSPQHFNENIKDLARRLKLNRVVTQMEFKGNKTKEVHYKLYEIISTKLMKKTYITFLISLGMSESEIGKYTGNSPETIRYYIDLYNTGSSDKIRNGFNNI